MDKMVEEKGKGTVAMGKGKGKQKDKKKQSQRKEAIQANIIDVASHGECFAIPRIAPISIL